MEGRVDEELHLDVHVPGHFPEDTTHRRLDLQLSAVIGQMHARRLFLPSLVSDRLQPPSGDIRLTHLLHAQMLEHPCCSGDALVLAMRVLTGAAVGLRMERDLAALLLFQCKDGG